MNVFPMRNSAKASCQVIVIKPISAITALRAEFTLLMLMLALVASGDASSETVMYFTSSTVIWFLTCPAMSSTAKHSLIGPDYIVISGHFGEKKHCHVSHVIRRVT